jgi:ubiquinone/menaquinone biosynthesis C-methylase UbiE
MSETGDPARTRGAPAARWVSNLKGACDVRIFREGPGPYALTEAMTGVRLGDRLIYLGAGDPAMFAALAAKVGLTGRARALVESEAASERIKEAAARAGVLIEVAIADFQGLALDNAAFDIAVIDATAGVVPQLSAGLRTAAGAAVLRALRPRGRAIVVERDKKGWFAAFKGRPEGVDAFRDQGAAAALLESAGFHPVRLLAERAGERFTEGWKRPEEPLTVDRSALTVDH